MCIYICIYSIYIYINIEYQRYNTYMNTNPWSHGFPPSRVALPRGSRGWAPSPQLGRSGQELGLWIVHIAWHLFSGGEFFMILWMVQKSESPVDRWFLHPMIFFGFQPSQIGGLSDFAGPSTVDSMDWYGYTPPKKGALQLQIFIDFPWFSNSRDFGWNWRCLNKRAYHMFQLLRTRIIMYYPGIPHVHSLRYTCKWGDHHKKCGS